MMAYPGETSRAARTTTAGTGYTELTVDPYASGDPAIVLIPDGHADGADAVLVLVAHGFNSSEATINGANFRPIRDLCLARGWVLASAYASGNAWANDAALADYRRIWDWVDDTWPVTDTLLHGASMGGLTFAVAYSRGTIPRVRGMAGVDSAVNLAASYARSTSYADAIRAAYDIAADGSDYATKTSGHDAVLLEPVTLMGKRLWLSASPDDTSIVKAQHTDLLVSHIAGYPAALETRTGAGEHVSPGTYFPDDVVAFFETALANPAPDWPTPEPLPAGVDEVELYFLLPDGTPVMVEAMPA